MSDCPYPGCHAPVDQTLRAERFACCEVCHRVSSLCSAGCGALNRPLARVCRQCGQAVSMAEAEDKWQQNLTLERDVGSRGVVERLDLSRLGARELRALCSYRGSLFIGTQGAGLVVSNPIRPSAGATVLAQLPQEEDIMALTPVETGEGPQLLVTTRQVVYQLHLLPDWQVNALYRARGGFLAPALGTPDGVVLFEPEGDEAAIHILPTDASWGVHKATLPLRAEAVRCMQLQQGHLLIFNSRACIVYDSRNRHTIWQGTPPQALDVTVESVYHVESQQVYIGGEGAVLRLALDEAQPTFFPVGDEPFQGFQLGVSRDGQELFLAHDQGVSILDSFTGRTKWTSATALGVRAASGVFPPRPVGNALLFGMLNRQGGHDVCLLPLQSRDDLVSFPGFSQILCPPCLGPGKLLLGGRQDNHLVVQAFDL